MKTKNQTPEANNNFGKAVEEMKIPHKNACGALVNQGDYDGSYKIACGDDLGGFNNEFYQCVDCRKKDIDEFNSQSSQSASGETIAVKSNHTNTSCKKSPLMRQHQQEGFTKDNQESKSGLSICQNVNSESSPDNFQQKLNEIERRIEKADFECNYDLMAMFKEDKRYLILGYLMAINEEIELIDICLKGYDKVDSIISWSESVSNLLKVSLRELTKIKSELEGK